MTASGLAGIARLDQFGLGFHVLDGLGYFACCLRDWLRRNGIASDLYAQFSNLPADAWRHYREWRPSPGGAVLLHYTTGCALNRAVAEAAVPRVMYYHNVTPPHFFAGSQPHDLAATEKGRAALPLLAPLFPVCWTHSEYSAAELRAAGAPRVRVVPLLRDFDRLNEPADPAWARQLAGFPGITLLAVSRVVPHKGDEELLALAAELAREHAVRVLRVGPGDAQWQRELASRAAAAGLADVVQFTGPLSQAAANACWRAADVFLCLSEHEGFGMPLVEAMHFGVPIVAVDRTAVRETLAGSGILAREFDVPLLARTALRAATDPALRAAVIGRQRQVLVRYQPAAVQAALAAALAADFPSGTLPVAS